MHVVDKTHLFIPERPVNRIADSLRNIIANPAAAVLFLVPGDPRVVEIVGGAEVTDDPELRSACEINGTVPKLGVLITVRVATLGDAPALAASEAWNPASHASESDLPTIGALVADPDHERSMARRAMSRMVDRAVQLDYGRNLY